MAKSPRKNLTKAIVIKVGVEEMSKLPQDAKKNPELLTVLDADAALPVASNPELLTVWQNPGMYGRKKPMAKRRKKRRTASNGVLYRKQGKKYLTWDKFKGAYLKKHKTKARKISVVIKKAGIAWRKLPIYHKTGGGRYVQVCAGTKKWTFARARKHMATKARKGKAVSRKRRRAANPRRRRRNPKKKTGARKGTWQKLVKKHGVKKAKRLYQKKRRKKR